MRTVAISLASPLRHIAQNAGCEGAVKVRKVIDAKGSMGLHAETGVLEDLVKAGVIDLAKVARSALENAASIVALLLTTGAIVADKPKPASASTGHGGPVA